METTGFEPVQVECKSTMLPINITSPKNPSYTPVYYLHNILKLIFPTAGLEPAPITGVDFKSTVSSIPPSGRYFKLIFN